MRVSRKSIFRSSHDLILIIGAMIALAMIVSKMVHSWRSAPPSLGMENSVTVAGSRVASR
ncbi:MAG: hypothetical protein ACREQH_09920 [Candidatus Binatus sp.]